MKRAFKGEAKDCDNCGTPFYVRPGAVGKKRFCGWRCFHDKRKSPEVRLAGFWAMVDKRGPEECWPWTGGMKSKTDPIQAYGVYRFDGKQRNAHRAAYIFTNGDPGPEYNVCHRCDNPRCCNPSHLFAATQKENVKDMIDKGRSFIRRAKRLPHGPFAKELP